MADKMKIFIYYGPLSHFEDVLPKENEYKTLQDIVYMLDEKSRQHFLIPQGSTPEEDKFSSCHVVARSNDYASLREHVIVNFTGLIELISPKCLHLHNPPARIAEQLGRVFKIEIQSYEYPKINIDILRKINSEFSNRIVGQLDVKERLLSSLYPLTDEQCIKPVVLMFYGPSGVGKTETAYFINELLGGKLMRKQFSMFQNERFASYLFGGSHSDASFAHDLLDRDSGVILLDEFDKANAIFHSAFYQLFDDGVFEDKNYCVKLGSSVIICTSNYRSVDEIRDKLGDALFSRFDASIEFKKLSKYEIKQIIERLVDSRLEKLSESNRQLIRSQEVKEKFFLHISEFDNVRSLGKLVDEAISLMLVRKVL